MKVSVLIVQFGDPKPTIACIKSIYKSTIDRKNFEIIIVDNNLDSSQKEIFTKKFPSIKYIKSQKNNYCHALNIGSKKSRGEFIHVLNPDTILDKNCILELLETFKNNKRVAGVSSKILFQKNKKINSLGIESLKDYYYQDIAMNEDDSELLRVRSIDYASGCSVMYLKEALKDVGFFDEDFVMYVEDVDMGIKLRKKKWTLKVNPKSIIYHAFHGTAKGVDLPSYFCNRNRFQLIAKHYPKEFIKQIKKSHPFINNQFEDLYHYLKSGIVKLLKEQPEKMTKVLLPKIIKEISKYYSYARVKNLINEIELYFGRKKINVCIYDHALHVIGGGQKYGCTIAEALQDEYDVTLISNKKVDKDTLEKWYNLNLKKCAIKNVPLEINENDQLINPTVAENAHENPFEPVCDESSKYDVLINVNMVPHIQPLALGSIFICHFPDGLKKNYFHVPQYNKIIANSKYTDLWIKKKWDLESDEIIHPPVDMISTGKINKEKIILSVSRFEQTGSKKQYEMAKLFSELYKKYPKHLNGWKLILAGGVTNNNSYLKKVKEFIKNRNVPIEIHTNISNSDLKKLYKSSSIFWHACGLGQHKKNNPHLIEHFGMTTVEAMQNGCAPIVINGGGQREIIKNKHNGFRFSNSFQLKKYTLKLIKNEKLLSEIQKNAQNSSKKFSKKIFQDKFVKVVDSVVKKIRKQKYIVPEAHDVYKKLTKK